MLQESFVKVMAVFDWLHLNDTVMINRFTNRPVALMNLKLYAQQCSTHTKYAAKGLVVCNFQKSEINIMKHYKNMIKSVMLHECFV